MKHKGMASLYLHQHVESWRRTTFQHDFLRTAPPRLLVGERDRFDTADQVRKRGIEQQVVGRLTVRRADKLDTALGNGSRRLCLKLSPDLVNDDHFGVVVFHRLDHDFMLQRWLGDLHPPRATNRRLRHVPLAADSLALLANHYPLSSRP